MRVLVVEDEPHIAAAVERGLRAERVSVWTLPRTAKRDCSSHGAQQRHNRAPSPGW
ncbi:response regulator [Streptomyces sp. NPDC102264]|uniref:response regulator n=1 Tax=Streptomyces sp. NPDC102264 TaxID=3366149 RepID=UPI003804D643